MHRLPTSVHNHSLQMLPGHAIQGCYGVQAATKVGFCVPAFSNNTLWKGKTLMRQRIGLHTGLDLEEA